MHWPAIRLCSLGVKQHVFLLNTKPGLAISVQLHGLFASMAIIGGMGCTVVIEGFAQDELVVATPEGISKDGYRLDQDIRVMAFCLSSG